MPEIQENVSLKRWNTFGLDAKARFFTILKQPEDILVLIAHEKWKKLPWLILGGGSNILLTHNFPGLVIRNEIKGIQVRDETADEVIVKAYSGEVWHDLVLYCIEKGWGGIENLSLIPGTTGAAPMQNIGAYGVELKDVFLSLEAIRLSDGEIEEFDLGSCHFGYRESIFKKKAKGKYFILSVTLKLSKKPVFNTSYGAIRQTLEEMGVKELTVSAISKAVCHIRSSKLPDPAVIGNAGSFFKNPEIPRRQYENIKLEYPSMPAYPVSEEMVKVPAGWLIESCGWKGKKVGNTGSHKEQALVLVNYGEASGDEILALAKEIQKSVKEKFNIDISPEVNVV